MKEGHESVFSQTKVTDLENVGWPGNLFIRHNISSAPRADTDALLHDLRFGARPGQRAKQEQQSSCLGIYPYLCSNMKDSSTKKSLQNIKSCKDVSNNNLKITEETPEVRSDPGSTLFEHQSASINLEQLLWPGL